MKKSKVHTPVELKKLELSILTAGGSRTKSQTRAEPREKAKEAGFGKSGCDLHRQPRECYHLNPVTVCQNTALL